MSLKNLKALKSITKVGLPVERTVKWVVEATDENIVFLKNTINEDVALGDLVDLEGKVFIKKLSFSDQAEIGKAYKFDVNKDDIDDFKLKSLDTQQLQSAQLLGTICEDEKGTPFFKNTGEVLASDPTFINALYAVSDEVNNFLGKSRKKNLKETNSGASLSSTESAEEPLKKQNKQ